MLVSGLVEKLTAEAARQAALGAGAKVLKVYSRQLTEADASEIAAIQPDIFLLTGGTDGGDELNILANAKMLSKLDLKCPILVAGNRSVAPECQKILANNGKEAIVCPNVMPKLGTLNIQPVQEEIRSLFLKRIIEAKGLSHIENLLTGIMMPTPVAVLKGLKLLSQGHGKEAGIGDLMAVDLGGATCDVYSIAKGDPLSINTILKGLPEPFAKRTVEGDIGMRINAHGIAAKDGLERLVEMCGIPSDQLNVMIDQLSENISQLPESEEQKRLDQALASLALETATIRHAGSVEETYTPAGLMYIQEGKDLREVDQMIFIGGTLVRGEGLEAAAEYCKYSSRYPASLRPKQFRTCSDKKYILSAMGLIAEDHPLEALRIMKKEIVYEQ
jgi:uncharacterized protein (TIGR01319 family)